MLLEFQRVDVQRFILLCGAHVVQHGSGCNRRRLVAVQPESLKRTHIQLPLDKRDRKVTRPHPILNPRPRRNPLQLRRKLRARSHQHLAGSGQQQRIDGLCPGIRAVKLRGAKLARRHIQQRERANRFSGSCAPGRCIVKRREKVVLFLPQPRIERRSRRQHARHLAPDDFLGKPGVFHLVAQSDAIALAQQAHQVLLHGVVGNAAHGNAALPVARRQRQLQLAAGHRGIVIKKLVKVAHAKEQQRIGVLLLRSGPLPHERRQFRGVLLRPSLFRGQGSKHKVFRCESLVRRSRARTTTFFQKRRVRSAAEFDVVPNHTAFQINAKSRTHRPALLS